MEIHSKTLGKFVDITVIIDNAKIDLGLFDKEELTTFLNDLNNDVDCLKEKLEYISD